uniref:Putative endodeoxyribonuclease n=1 Tax=viral metagenome TaxID=1070528 RepID=A0A6M3JAY5_9ZZZZ
MKSIQITIEGRPVAQARPRFFRRGKIVGTYSGQAKDKKAWISQAILQIKGHLEGPLAVSMVFLMPIPKGTSKKNVDAMLDCKIHHTKKPDIDNLGKWVLDCLNGIAYQDDSQIIHLASRKLYGTAPKTMISIDVIG